MYARGFSEIRVRTKVAPEVIEAAKGKILSDNAYDVLLTGPTIVRDAAGRLLAKYLPKAFDDALLDSTYDVLHGLRTQQTDNRGYAAGGARVKRNEQSTWSYAPSIASATIGNFDAAPPKNYCRLTAWSGRETEKFRSLFPLFEAIGEHFAEQVPDRYATQMEYVRRTHPDWHIGTTPFTTITVNNSYPTGVHTDSGDLDEGFSTLTVLRKGNYSGGIFTFPEYRIAVDMQHGDLLLMDAHQWHGNTAMTCNVCGEGIGSKNYYPSHDACGSERISVVAYYRTKMAECGSMEEETKRAMEVAERRADIAAEHTLSDMSQRAIEEMAVEAVG